MPFEKNREQIQELSDMLKQGVQEVFTGGRYAAYLSAMSHFHRYSYRNTMLIFMQKPDATHVAGFNAWKRLGRSVNKGEKGLRIFAPAPYKRTIEITRDENGISLAEPRQKEIVVPAYKPAYVFDISQTNGRELPELTHRLAGKVGEYDIILNALKKISPYPISFEPLEGASANGFCNYKEQRIVIREGLSQEQSVQTAVHEIAHAIMHVPNTEATPDTFGRTAHEIQAESVAFIVCQRIGIDSSEYSFGYVASWAQDKDLKVLETSLNAIHDGVLQIAESLEPEIERQRELQASREADKIPLTETLPDNFEKANEKAAIAKQEPSITLASDHITVAGHVGVWYAIDQATIEGRDFFLLEHEIHGDMASGVIVDAKGTLFMEDVNNGFDDWHERLDELHFLHSEESGLEHTQEWRNELLPGEKELVAQWDKQYEKGVLNVANDILEADKSRAEKIENIKSTTLYGIPADNADRANTAKAPQQPSRISDRLAAAKLECERINAERHTAPEHEKKQTATR